MNARQKAKKYKKQMELYKTKAEILDSILTNDMIKLDCRLEVIKR